MKTLLLLTLIIALTLFSSATPAVSSSFVPLWGLGFGAWGLGFGNSATSITPSSFIPHPSSLNVPIVFVSRNRMDTVDGLHVGPPVNARGRESIPGGRLRVLYPDGTVADLTDGREIYDVADPDVSYDAKHVVFAGVPAPDGRWRIYEIGIDGTGLRQLTFSDWPVPPDLAPAQRRAAGRFLQAYGDFCPAYLPDGRIIFASTRYPTQSASCGERGTNLYVMNPDGSTLHRVTTTRAGVYDPSILSDGRVLLTQWSDNQNVPAPAGPGLREPIADVNFAPSAWNIWAMRPDGSNTGHYAFTFGPLEDQGGLCQPREMPDGRIVFTVRGAPGLLGDTLPSGIAIARPGMGKEGKLQVLGNPRGLEGPHALSPAPLPDGRIVCAYTPEPSAAFNFGLYVVGDDLRDPVLLYDDVATDELDPVPAVAREVPPVLPDGPHADSASEDPRAPAAYTATLICHNVYADLPLEVNPIPSPLVGTVTHVDFYDDGPVFTSTIPGIPPRKAPARLIDSVPVNPDGSFTATVPADRPIFWVLCSTTGVVARYPLSPEHPRRPVGSMEPYVPGHDWFRPGQVASCTGCHQGHMIRPDLAMEAQANLARVATASASSTRSEFEFWVGAGRANDGRLAEGRGRFAWVAAERDPAPWVKLRWPAPVTVTDMAFYPLPGAHPASARLTASDGTTRDVPWVPPAHNGPITLAFDEPLQVEWLRLELTGDGLLGLAEWAIYGPADVSFPAAPPPAPANLRLPFPDAPVAWLSWDPAPLAGLAGYRIHYGPAPGVYTATADVGNVTHHLLAGLTDGQTVYAVVRAVNIASVEGAPSNEVRVTARAPVIESVTPASGPTAGGTRVTITGRNFSPRGVVVRIGHRSRGAQVRVIDEHTIEAVTYRAWEPGPVDVEVVNPDGLGAVLPKGFTYQ